MGQRMIILNSSEHAINLLEKRSAKSSDRPILHMTGEMIGWDRSLVLLQYGDQFKEIRKYLYHTIGKKATLERYFPLVERQVQRFMLRLLDSPEEFVAHIRWYALR